MTTENKNNGNKCANVNCAAVKTRRINGCNYKINIFFSKQSSNTVTQKLERLVCNEVLKKI